MSDSFFKFTVRCPKCGAIHAQADGFETDDWFEVFVFSGYSRKSAKYGYDPNYICPSCSEKTYIDFLYRGHFIEPESIEEIIEYLEMQIPTVVKDGGLYDHGWDPDFDVVLSRYCLLYPKNPDLARLKDLYYKAIHYPRFFRKFEPAYGTTIVSADMISYRELLNRIYLPDTVTTISDNTFSNTNILDLFLPRNVTSVGKNAFKNCEFLSTVHSSDELKKIGDYAFSGTKISKFYFPDGITEIGECAFENTELVEVYIPESCKYIGDGAFANCSNLKKVTIPQKFTEIERYFEPTADIIYLNNSNESGSEQQLFDLQEDDIYSYLKSEKKYDLMVVFTCSDALTQPFKADSLNSTMNNDCLSVCKDLVNDPCIAIGEFRIIDESGIKITDKTMVVKVPNLKEWKRDDNFNQVKEIYGNIIKYAISKGFRKIAFPLWPQEWDFFYYSDLLLHIKPILKMYNGYLDSISWYKNSDDFFYSYYGSSLKEIIKKIFHTIKIEKI